MSKLRDRLASLEAKRSHDREGARVRLSARLATTAARQEPMPAAAARMALLKRLAGKPENSPLGFVIGRAEADPLDPDHGPGDNVATNSHSTCMHTNVIE